MSKKGKQVLTPGVPTELQTEVVSFERILENIENYLQPFFKSSLKENAENLSGLEAAKLNIVIAYAINTLFYSMFMLIFVCVSLFTLMS